MIATTLHFARDLRWTIVFAAIVGLAFEPTKEALLGAYDQYKPVVIMQGKVVKRDTDSVVVHIWGEKKRECTYVQIQAFARAPGAALSTHLSITREDAPEVGSTKPIGVHDLGFWRLRPRGEGGVFSVYTQHKCQDRIVNTLVAEVTV